MSTHTDQKGHMDTVGLVLVGLLLMQSSRPGTTQSVHAPAKHCRPEDVAWCINFARSLTHDLNELTTKPWKAEKGALQQPAVTRARIGDQEEDVPVTVAERLLTTGPALSRVLPEGLLRGFAEPMEALTYQLTYESPSARLPIAIVEVSFFRDETVITVGGSNPEAVQELKRELVFRVGSLGRATSFL